ncbi:hypothetical protein COW36_11020 [bacterium (Candidatus Blackallbacteria) CG17_big_fil_post_rev_8_21_14_2_50_48_46]|uniref:DUF2188 domain-containing protein n=1 Tax=bacterium (Candidatus Blackallbacteria) CG17_big_fil_post_rev_8_21_14_2_50_48_46 TaxID=2014261 RepID=A0A2M7G4G7_9BACT|nr:MAG: hypothetical protein COW64_18115 [bacterium (Candidatus Blackallbacteria) CG18_big_fil_WC_8_21_14_2_50_49_26]PIW16806.1 MAG: hypothetical protein COW36_11020 [bacterium (Candidatus Blackallbacteria) CG17_big_fil_post_rev_8_21_14_2_50_48_46]PIW48003.1 MAG: hypothetical protein COW20_10735 [bacterium (Candidatus Blackallbacteria) CG13_big_fil_rev_8_21_14_2_50_49_14]
MKSLTTLFTAALLISGLTACQSQVSPIALAPAAYMQAQASARVIYHVVPDSKAGLWHIKLQRNPQPVASFKTKEAAVAAGRVLGRSHELGQLIVHKANGQIETEYTYGKDPASSVG